MEQELNGLFAVDFRALVQDLFTIIACFVAAGTLIIKAIEIVGKMIGKPVNWFKKQNKDHELIMENTKAIKELAEIHKRDNEISNEHDEKIQEELSEFMNDVKYKIEQIAFDRINDREKSREIRADLAASIKIIAEDNEKKGVQIEALMLAQREVLADKINQKYKQYIQQKGIPEDEYDEFVNLHAAYKKCGGNSSGDAKFEYCINHLPILPVEKKLVIKHEQ